MGYYHKYLYGQCACPVLQIEMLLESEQPFYIGDRSCCEASHQLRRGRFARHVAYESAHAGSQCPTQCPFTDCATCSQWRTRLKGFCGARHFGATRPLLVLRRLLDGELLRAQLPSTPVGTSVSRRAAYENSLGTSTVFVLAGLSDQLFDHKALDQHVQPGLP